MTWLHQQHNVTSRSTNDHTRRATRANAGAAGHLRTTHIHATNTCSAHTPLLQGIKKRVHAATSRGANGADTQPRLHTIAKGCRHCRSGHSSTRAGAAHQCHMRLVWPGPLLAIGATGLLPAESKNAVCAGTLFSHALSLLFLETGNASLYGLHTVTKTANSSSSVVVHGTGATSRTAVWHHTGGSTRGAQQGTCLAQVLSHTPTRTRTSHPSTHTTPLYTHHPDTYTPPLHTTRAPASQSSHTGTS